MMAALRFSVSVPAKINLHLQILGRRWDGFHELRTLFQSIDLFDRIEAEEAPPDEMALEVTPEDAVEAGGGNLVLRAARLLAREAGISNGARLHLDKRIPVGGGLGGGSADAAATLVLLDRLWGCDLDEMGLHRLAAALGSDVPFFLHGGLALGIGRGDEVFPLPDEAELATVVVVPNVRISTAEVYRSHDGQLTSHRQKGNLYAFAAGLRGKLDWRAMANELEEIVVRSWPEVGEGLRVLRSSGSLHASLSGSGAASYAVFDDPVAARRAADKLPADWFVHVGSTLPRRSAGLVVKRCDGGRRWK
jgi:4-diphosphocytidyl-2-C-methyl-D-erythritol kinase